jgi:hypothetical protein
MDKLLTDGIDLDAVNSRQQSRAIDNLQRMVTWLHSPVETEVCIVEEMSSEIGVE